jgi:formylglycine-generating enzyme required for sulfatase activity
MPVGEMVFMPEHGLWMDKYEVTNAEYGYFVRAENRQAPSCAPTADWNRWEGPYPPPSKENHPVVCISRQQAIDYCEWVNKQLPSAAVWKRACQGKTNRLYPWGADLDRSKSNYGADKCCDGDASDGFFYTATVDSFPSGSNSLGIMHLAGNVWEWTTPQEIMGGSWYNNPENIGCGASAKVESGSHNTVGFRCTKYEQPQ